MSQQIDTALVNSYKSIINLKFQQMTSRIKPYVRNETQKSEHDFFDRVGLVEVQEVVSRHGETNYSETPHDRRMVSLRSFDFADLIDRQDKMRMLADPTSPYVMNAVAGMQRKIDDVIIEAALGTAYTGKAGATATAFPAAQQVAVNYVETPYAGASVSTANSNLTLAKLRKAQYLLDVNEANNDNGMPVIIWGASQRQSLLATTQVTSSDYAVVKALVNGEIDTFMGFKFIRTQRLKNNSSGYRRVIAFVAGSGLLLSTGEDLVVEVDRLPTRRYSTQVFVAAGFGAVRMWEEQVVEIVCDETYIGNN